MDSDKLKMQLRDIPIPSGLRDRSRLGIEQASRERKGKPLRRRMRFAAAMLGLVLLSVTILNHSKVWAAIHKALQFVPGIGVVEEDGSASSARYLLREPIKVDFGGGTVVITGISTDDETTYLTMVGKEAPEFKQLTIVNEQGEAYTIDRSLASLSSLEWTAFFRREGKLNIEGDIKLILQTQPAVEVSAHLEKAESYSGYEELGPTVKANGLSVTAIPDRVGDKGRVSLVTAPAADYRDIDFGIIGMYVHKSRKLNMTDAEGKKLPIEYVHSITGPQSEFYFPLSDNPHEHYTLTLPEVSVRYPNEKTTVKVSTKEQEQMRQTFELAGFPITITKTDRLSNGKHLRLYLDMHFDQYAADSLSSFELERTGFSGKLNSNTGVYEYIDLAIDPGDDTIEITFNNPVAVLRGPWTFEWSAEDFKAAQ